MLFKINFSKESGRPLGMYYVEADTIQAAADKAQQEAEREYTEKKPIVINKIETVTHMKVIR